METEKWNDMKVSKRARSGFELRIPLCMSYTPTSYNCHFVFHPSRSNENAHTHTKGTWSPFSNHITWKNIWISKTDVIQTITSLAMFTRCYFSVPLVSCDKLYRIEDLVRVHMIGFESQNIFWKNAFNI